MWGSQGTQSTWDWASGTSRSLPAAFPHAEAREPPWLPSEQHAFGGSMHPCVRHPAIGVVGHLRGRECRVSRSLVTNHRASEDAAIGVIGSDVGPRCRRGDSGISRRVTAAQGIYLLCD